MNIPLITPNTCSTCAFRFRDQRPVPGPQGLTVQEVLFCRRNPPVAQLMVAHVSRSMRDASGKKTEAMMPEVVGEGVVHPRVQPDWWCGEYRRIAAVVDGPMKRPNQVNGEHVVKLD